MTVPYSLVFFALLAGYVLYSFWARLDARYPIVAALLLLIATAFTDAAGAVSLANTLGEYVLFLLAAGVVLLLLEHLVEPRDGPDAGASLGPAGATVRPRAEPVQQLDPPAQQVLDRPEQ